VTLVHWECTVIGLHVLYVLICNDLRDIRLFTRKAILIGLQKKVSCTLILVLHQSINVIHLYFTKKMTYLITYFNYTFPRNIGNQSCMTIVFLVRNLYQSCMIISFLVYILISHAWLTFLFSMHDYIFSSQKSLISLTWLYFFSF
jgi:hypothetical protein